MCSLLHLWVAVFNKAYEAPMSYEAPMTASDVVSLLIFFQNPDIEKEKENDKSSLLSSPC